VGGEPRELDEVAMLDLLHRELLAQGWEDPDDAAGAVIEAIRARSGKSLAGVDLTATIPPDFLQRNGIDLDRAERFLQNTIGELSLASPPDARTLLLPEQIDSFAQITNVSAQGVAAFSQPLLLKEKVVKQLLLSILGHTDADVDWGGERSDGFTTNVLLGGERIATSFVLKGPSQRGELTPKRYGANGDQIQRSFTQPASLHIIQANARLAPSITELTEGLVYHARAHGRPHAAASIWDGIDTARILVAYGKIDPRTGAELS
jgi:hypothetical protein